MTEQQESEIHATISALAKNFESTFESGDVKKLAEFYTSNGTLLPDGSDFVEGRQAIQEYWQAAVDMGIKSIKLDIIEIEQHDDTVIEMSKYTLNSTDGQGIDNGKGIVIWKNKDGTWKMHRDIWNSSLGQQ